MRLGLLVQTGVLDLRCDNLAAMGGHCGALGRGETQRALAFGVPILLDNLVGVLIAHLGNRRTLPGGCLLARD